MASIHPVMTLSVGCVDKEIVMSKRPEVCRYCDGHGNSSAGGKCGFCEDGVPLDTQADWDESWGKIFKKDV